MLSSGCRCLAGKETYEVPVCEPTGQRILRYLRSISGVRSYLEEWYFLSWDSKIGVKYIGI